MTLITKLPAVALVLTSPPRTWTCLVVSVARLAVSTGLTVTVVGAAVDGVIASDAARLKSSARFATLPWVMTSGAFDGSVRVTVMVVGFGATSGSEVAPSMMLPAAMVTLPLPPSTTMVAAL